MSKKDWKKLLDYTCPICESQLHNEDNLLIHECSNEDYMFRITEERMTDIVHDLTKSPFEEPDRSGWEW
jgi:hypothetical protein